MGGGFLFFSFLAYLLTYLVDTVVLLSALWALQTLLGGGGEGVGLDATLHCISLFLG